jgi:hypothetical protein
MSEAASVASITKEGVLMGRDKEYPLTPAMEANLERLVDCVNNLLVLAAARGIVRGTVTSGYRPGPYNKKAGGATTSAHCTCEAVDLADPGQDLAHYLQQDWIRNGNTKSLLKSCGLYMEHPDATKGLVGSWIHLTIRAPGSGNRVFKP